MNENDEKKHYKFQDCRILEPGHLFWTAVVLCEGRFVFVPKEAGVLLASMQSFE